MTPTEFLTKMNQIFGRDKDGYSPDTEEAHVFADDLMCELLKSLGYGAGIEIFEKAGKWYA